MRRDVVDPAVSTGAPRLIDTFGRVHRDLRISVTDRCNLRCTYCMTEHGMTFMDRSELLTFDEIVRVARVAKTAGVTSIRLTGGEPLIRPHLDRLVSSLAGLGFDDLALTTNAMTLAQHASRLAGAGLTRVNVSCDSLRAERFRTIRRRGDLATVLKGMDAAEAAGLGPLKVNVVLMAGINDDEILDFAAFARQTGRIVRFIEFMPLDEPGVWTRDAVVPGQQILDTIAAVWPLVACIDPEAPSTAPAERFAFRDSRGEIGVIRSVTAPFCGTCDRLRLTAEGTMRNCLFGDDEVDLRRLLRHGCSDDELFQLLVRSVSSKRAGHGINDPAFIRPVRSMSMIGG